MKYNLVIYSSKTGVTTVFTSMLYNHASALCKIFNMGAIGYKAMFFTADKMLSEVIPAHSFENIQVIEGE